MDGLIAVTPCPSFLLSFCVNNLLSIDRLNVIKICAPSKIRTRDHWIIRQGAVHTIYKDHFMVCIQMVMTAEKATKLGHDQVTRLEACFVVVLLMFHNTF